MVDPDFKDRLAEVIRRAATKLGPEASWQLRALLDPTALAITAGVIVVWIGSHAFGVGLAVDIVLGVVGFVAVGWAVFEGIDEFIDFARKAHSARTDADLDQAASHLARAIGILGIQAVLALLTRGRANTARGTRLPAGPPPTANGWRFHPSTTGTRLLPAGVGETSFWGNITFSTLGSAQDQRLVLLHERVHQVLAPKLYFMRNVRVQGRISSYFRSSLYRWFEEMLAETFARMRVLGVNPQQTWQGISFPVREGYVLLTRGGGYAPEMVGRGLLPEGAALLASGTILGVPSMASHTITPPVSGGER